MMIDARSAEEPMSLDFDVFIVDPKPITSAVPGFEQAAGPATWPPSTDTYPDFASPYTLWVAAYDLLGART